MNLDEFARKLIETLWWYVRHDENCPKSPFQPCNCGLDQFEEHAAEERWWT